MPNPVPDPFLQNAPGTSTHVQVLSAAVTGWPFTGSAGEHVGPPVLVDEPPCDAPDEAPVDVAPVEEDAAANDEAALEDAPDIPAWDAETPAPDDGEVPLDANADPEDALPVEALLSARDDAFDDETRESAPVEVEDACALVPAAEDTPADDALLLACVEVPPASEDEELSALAAPPPLELLDPDEAPPEELQEDNAASAGTMNQGRERVMCMRAHYLEHPRSLLL